MIGHVKSHGHADFLIVSGLGLTKFRVLIDSGPDKLDIQIKTSYVDLVWIINRTLYSDSDPDSNIRCPDPIVRIFEFVM